MIEQQIANLEMRIELLQIQFKTVGEILAEIEERIDIIQRRSDEQHTSI